MTQSDKSDSETRPDPGGLWGFTLRWDEFPVLRAALIGRRLSADEADAAALLCERLETMAQQIEDQAQARK